VPGVARENYWFRRHEAAYAWIAHRFDLVGASIVDAGSGEGYGANILLQAGAGEVTALEYDESAAAHSRATYPGVTTIRINLDAMPLADARADVIVTMQVIEHLWDLPRFLGECRRVLRPGGLLVAATPNRLTFSPGVGRGQKPANPFHVEEFDADQIAGMLTSAGFADVELWGVHHGPGIREGVVQRQVDAMLADSWSPDLLNEVARVRVADFELRTERIDHCLDLIGVARRP